MRKRKPRRPQIGFDTTLKRREKVAVIASLRGVTQSTVLNGLIDSLPDPVPVKPAPKPKPKPEPKPEKPEQLPEVTEFLAGLGQRITNALLQIAAEVEKETT